jgi:hypothetical protein
VTKPSSRLQVIERSMAGSSVAALRSDDYA